MGNGLYLAVALGAANGWQGGVAYDPDAAALFVRMTAQPDAIRKTLINTTIVNLKAAGVWALAGFIHFQAAHDAQAGRLCWNNAAYDLTATGSPAFTTDRGYTGDAVGAYLSTGAANNAIPNYAQDAATVATWETLDIGDAGFAMGNLTSSGLRTFGKDGSNLRGGRVNSVSASVTAASADARGLTAVTRPIAASQDLYANGAFAGNTTSASAAPNSGAVLYLRGVAIYSGRRVGFGFAGGTLTAQNHADLYTIVNTYMTAIGAA